MRMWVATRLHLLILMALLGHRDSSALFAVHSMVGVASTVRLAKQSQRIRKAKFLHCGFRRLRNLVGAHLTHRVSARRTNVSTKQTNSDLQSVIDIYDPETACIVASTALDAVQTKKIAIDLEISVEDLAMGATFELDRSDLAHIKSQFRIDLDDAATEARLRRRLDVDDLPYQVHTNRELLLMLQNRKPLSVFSTYYPPESGEFVPEQLFEPYVHSGRLIKREVVEATLTGDQRQIRRVFYALPAEAWRIDAYMLMVRTAGISGWSEALERMEGSLLGYSDEQNNCYLDLLKRRSIP